jgi:hypothetical protein
MSKAKTLISETPPASPFIGRKVQLNPALPVWVIEGVSGEGETVLHLRNGDNRLLHAVSNDSIAEFFVRYEVKEATNDNSHPLN